MARIGRKKAEITKEPEALTEENMNTIRDAGEMTFSMIPDESEEISVNENSNNETLNEDIDTNTDELEETNEAEIESQSVKKQLNNSLQDFLY